MWKNIVPLAALGFLSIACGSDPVTISPKQTLSVMVAATGSGDQAAGSHEFLLDPGSYRVRARLDYVGGATAAARIDVVRVTATGTAAVDSHPFTVDADRYHFRDAEPFSSTDEKPLEIVDAPPNPLTLVLKTPSHSTDARPVGLLLAAVELTSAAPITVDVIRQDQVSDSADFPILFTATDNAPSPFVISALREGEQQPVGGSSSEPENGLYQISLSLSPGEWSVTASVGVGPTYERTFSLSLTTVR